MPGPTHCDSAYFFTWRPTWGWLPNSKSEDIQVIVRLPVGLTAAVRRRLVSKGLATPRNLQITEKRHLYWEIIFGEEEKRSLKPRGNSEKEKRKRKICSRVYITENGRRKKKIVRVCWKEESC